MQGVGAAIVTPLSLTILTSSFPAAKRGAVVGIWGGIAGLAVAGGPLVGGAVVQGLSWHWIFWVNVPIGFAAAIASARLLPEGYGPARRLDLPALPLIAFAALALTWGLVRAGGSGWGDGFTVALLAGGAALLAGFVLRERVAADPMVPLRLFRNRTFTAANAAAFLQSGAIFSAAFLTTEYFQLGLGYGPLATGLRLLPWTATPMIVAPLAGTLADRIGARPLLVTGLALQAGGLAWFAAIASAGRRLRAVRGAADHRRGGHLDVDSHVGLGGARRGAAGRGGHRLRREQHHGAVRRGVRRGDRDRRVHRARLAGFRGGRGRRVPAGARGVRGAVAGRVGRRGGHRPPPCGGGGGHVARPGRRAPGDGHGAVVGP